MSLYFFTFTLIIVAGIKLRKCFRLKFIINRQAISLSLTSWVKFLQFRYSTGINSVILWQRVGSLANNILYGTLGMFHRIIEYSELDVVYFCSLDLSKIFLWDFISVNICNIRVGSTWICLPWVFNEIISAS